MWNGLSILSIWPIFFREIGTNATVLRIGTWIFRSIAIYLTDYSKIWRSIPSRYSLSAAIGFKKCQSIPIASNNWPPIVIGPYRLPIDLEHVVQAVVVLMSCMAIVVWPSILASLQCRDEARRIFTDQAGIAWYRGAFGLIEYGSVVSVRNIVVLQAARVAVGI